MAELLVFGSWAFWLLCVIYLVAIFALVKYDNGFGSFFTTVAFILLVQFVFRVDVFTWVVENPIKAVLLFCSYFVIGTVWSVWKWYLYALNMANQYFELKAEYLRNCRKEEDKTPEKWAEYVLSRYNSNFTKPPLVSDHKSDIMRWIMAWPISVALWALDDMLRGIAKAIYNHISGVLQGIANKVYERVRRDLPSAENMGE